MVNGVLDAAKVEQVVNHAQEQNHKRKYLYHT